MSEDTLCKLAKRAADQGNKGYRFVDRHEKATYIRYDELFEKSMGVAGAFHKKGIKAGDRIAIVLPTCPEFFYVFFGALFVGGVPVPLYPPVRLGRMDEYHKNTARMLKVSGARLLCTDGRINKILGRSLATASPELGCVTVDEIGHEPFKYKEGNPDGPALIQFSSGTTVDPKPVLLTHRQIIANVRTILDCALNFYPEDTDEYSICGVSWLPLYHDMGLIGAAMVALMHPADLTLIPPELFIARPAIWLRTISKYRAFLSPAPNFAYSICTEKIKDNELKGVDLSCWKIALNGAEPVSPSALKKFIERFEAYGFPPHALTPVYGLSEAALAVTFSNIDQRFDSKKFNADLLLKGRAVEDSKGNELASLGKALPGYQIEIRNGNGEEVPDSIIGTIYAKGPSIMKEYFCNPKATACILNNSWLNTGDAGFIFKGDLYLYGREKDIVIIRGRNYSSQVIEMALDNVFGIRKGCVAATGYVPEGDENERLIVFIERDKEGNKRGDIDLANRASKKITESVGLVPESVIVLELGTILRTSSGKLRRSETLRQYLMGTLAPPKQVNIFQMTVEMIRSKIAISRMRQNI